MCARVSIYPPLGQVTQLKHTHVSFFAVLDVDAKDAEEQWDVAIWHSSDGKGWDETLMSPASVRASPTSLQHTSPSNRRVHLSAELTVLSSLNFTVKFRNGRDDPWRWAREAEGIDDGVILINPENKRRRWADSLPHIIHGLNPKLTVKSVASQAPRTQLWTIEAAIGPADDHNSAYVDMELGTPWGGFLRGLDNVMTLFRSSSSGPVMLHIRSDHDTESTGLVLAAVGDSFESAMAAVMYHARTVAMATSSSDDSLSRELQTLSDDVRPEWMENWYDGLGYCTWNALGQDLTEDKLVSAVDVLAKNNIHISSLIIDDNWQDIDHSGQDQYQRGWKSFEAEPTAFPSGLKHTVSQIRSKCPSIKHIAVWHALLGYWGGISPDGNLAKRYKTVELERDGSNLDGPMTVIANKDVRRFYDDFYRFLSDCGIEGVKTDVQYMLDTWVSAKQRRELTNTYLDAWAISALRHFSIKAISCMSQAPQVLFHQQLPRNRPVMLVRNSDDFFPEVPASHPWHLWANAHNTLLTQHLNILPDWDMFQTDHEFAGYHAAARCVSGGPIYITDTPGHHNLDLINQMTGVTPRGKTVIFRPSVLGKTINQYTGYDEDSILKVGSYHGKAVTGTPILAVFNTRQRSLTEIIPISWIPGVIPSMKYVVRAHNSGMVTGVAQPGSPVAHLTVSLDVRGYDIFTAFAVTQFDSETNGRIFTANLGLVGKMTGAAAIMSTHLELLHTGKVLLDMRLKALGTLGLYISSLPDMSIERDFMVTIQGQPIPPHTVTVNTSDRHVLDVDVETAWNEMGLKAGWNNEVEVKAYFDIEHP
ncbi:Uu.00g034140.m01.CDS01 [Anthostomella pinea]|uniref:Uu.00g034140.m01.CDS01 n=1 Tax=Anthostomella pinea TaxID=933095 RepID=A0AAI8VA09_9PEZI|nr:Uu.00g034140.m01.CDS01 [Anthostomella pinea]